MKRKVFLARTNHVDFGKVTSCAFDRNVYDDFMNNGGSVGDILSVTVYGGKSGRETWSMVINEIPFWDGARTEAQIRANPIVPGQVGHGNAGKGIHRCVFRSVSLEPVGNHFRKFM